MQILNACLTLLSDEDTDIRMKAVEFVCKLKGHHDQHQQRRKVCRVEAMRKVTLIGLNFFEDCAEYFKPISDLAAVDWTLATSQSSSSQLFDHGDGINVYAEEAFENDLYCKVLMAWLEDKDSKPKFR